MATPQHYNYHERTDEPLGEPEHAPCGMGITSLCTDEASGYTWDDIPVCLPCLKVCEAHAERAAERNAAGGLEDWYGSDRPQCEAERVAVEMERRR